MKRRFRKRWGWGLLNVAGLILFLKLCSVLSVLPGEGGLPGGPGDAFFFAFAVLPVIVAFLILNLVALGWILLRTPQGERLTALMLWLLAAALWCGAVAWDFHRSHRTVDSAYADLINPAPRP